MDNQNQQSDESPSVSPIHPPGHVITPESNNTDQSILNNATTPPINQSFSGQPTNNSAPSVSQQPRSALQPQVIIQKSRKWKSPLLLSLIILVIFLAVGGVYAYHSTRHKTVTSSKVVTNKASNSLGTASITEPVTTTVNCGSDSCFATYFQKCSPATETADSPMANVKYQIYGKKNNGCNMQFEYLATPNPAWDNKSMICIFDNSQSLDNAVSAVITNLSNKKNDYSCAGPLVALLQNQ